MPPAKFRVGQTNVDQNDPETQKDVQPLVDAPEVNATSMPTLESTESASIWPNSNVGGPADIP